MTLRDQRAAGRSGADLARALAAAYAHAIGDAADPVGALARCLDFARLRGLTVVVGERLAGRVIGPEETC